MMAMDPLTLFRCHFHEQGNGPIITTIMSVKANWNQLVISGTEFPLDREKGAKSLVKSDECDCSQKWFHYPLPNLLILLHSQFEKSRLSSFTENNNACNGDMDE